MDRLLKRAEFLAAAKGARSARRGFVVQALLRPDGDDPGPPRVGFTVTKKVGNAPERNRIRRRLREAMRLHGAEVARPGTDYVLVGRREALGLAFADLAADLRGALKQVHRDPRPGGPAGGRRKPPAVSGPSDDPSPGGTR
ncbi:ribonuclease P protein component [Prosthecomicrobium sp. N25]|uniref:ribonuclease P protein component n=1 Tax=Prosthecomicrobium sp. N25 TaxID=3129254 RepID=UPI00307712A6